MTDIYKIIVHITTSGVNGAGTDGDVYIGIAGREFNIDSSSNDFERGARRAYVLGEAIGEDEADHKILHPKQNDPRNPQLDTEDIDRFPIYLRFEPRGEHPNWCLEEVVVVVYYKSVEMSRYGALRPTNSSELPYENPHLWLGQNMGKFLYLKEFVYPMGVKKNIKK